MYQSKTSSHFIPHENYDAVNKKNDIAVIKMSRDVDFGRSIRPACLWSSFSVNDTKAVATDE